MPADGHLSALMAVKTDKKEWRRLPVKAVLGCLPVFGQFSFMPGNDTTVRMRFLGSMVFGNDLTAGSIMNIERTPPVSLGMGMCWLPACN